MLRIKNYIIKLDCMKRKLSPSTTLSKLEKPENWAWCIYRLSGHKYFLSKNVYDKLSKALSKC